MLNVGFPPGEEVVEDDDFVAFGHESIDEVRSHEAGSSGHEDLFPEGVWETFSEDDVGGVEGGDGLGGEELLVSDQAVDVLAFGVRSGGIIIDVGAFGRRGLIGHGVCFG